MKTLAFVARNLMTPIILMLNISFAVQADAAVPRLLAYQGILKDSSGNFLTGSYSMTFRLYTASTGGSPVWTETQSSVSASSGKFSVHLGSVTALSLDFNSDYWISVQVGADAEMSPRVRLTSMAYGIRSDYENNGFEQVDHDALSHKNIEGVRENSVNIAKTNFKVDAYSLASAHNMGDLILESFNDAAGINSGASSDYLWRGSADYDVIVSPGGIDSDAKLVLHGNGTDGSSVITDSSSGTKTVTANGNAQIDTAQSKFGGASILFDGSGDFATIPDSGDWDFGTGDFTIDFWIRFNSVGGSQYVFAHGTDSMNYASIAWDGSSWKFNIGVSNSLVLSVSGSDSLSTGTWYHLALVRNGSDWRIYRDGVAKGNTTQSYTYPNWTQSLALGSLVVDGNYGYGLNGWLDEIRVSKGIARWTTNFTPPSAEFTVSSGSATVISTAYSEASAPTEVMLIADETLNAGSIVYSVSRDNGTTWTSCTKETITDISAQPSGTQIKWKAVITDDAELNAIAVAV